MKRFGIFAACLLLLVASGLKGASLAWTGKDYPSAQYTFYVIDSPEVRSSVGGVKGVEIVANGYTAQVNCPWDLADSIRPVLTNIGGESVRFGGDKQDITYLIEKYGVEIKDSAEFENVFTVYGYSAAFKDYQTVIDGNRINIQIAYRNGVVTVGSPVILGSY